MKLNEVCLAFPLGKVRRAGPIYELVSQGLSDRAIANTLNLNEATVHGCICWVMHSLKCEKRVDLVSYSAPHERQTSSALGRRNGELMMSLAGSQPMQTARLEQTLEYAVVQNWDELMPSSPSGVIHIEYQTGEDGSLDFAMVWASTIRGHWKRVCEFWIKPLWSHTTGLRFESDSPPLNFAHILKVVVGHANAFSKLPDRQGLIQVYSPTEDERGAARRWMEVVFDREGPVPVQQTVAA